jgi:ABC-type uncharacterized transport system permease subunit
MYAIVALACYFAAGILILKRQLAGGPESHPHGIGPALLLGAAGLAIHSISLGGLVGGHAGPELSLGGVMSLVGWLLGLFALVGAVKPRFRGLAAVVLPVAGIAALAALMPEPVSQREEPLSWTIHAHVVMSVLAYSLLSLGAALAVLFLLRDRSLRRRELFGWTRILPPLESLEQALFTAIGSGFALLTLAVFSGLIFVEDIFAQHLVHKSVLSIVAWCVFAVLLAGRWRLGWRGRQAVHWALAGYGLLALAYFGSRIVLEFILGRQWMLAGL